MSYLGTRHKDPRGLVPQKSGDLEDENFETLSRPSNAPYHSLLQLVDITMRHRSHCRILMATSEPFPIFWAQKPTVRSVPHCFIWMTPVNIEKHAIVDMGIGQVWFPGTDTSVAQRSPIEFRRCEGIRMRRWSLKSTSWTMWYCIHWLILTNIYQWVRTPLLDMSGNVRISMKRRIGQRKSHSKMWKKKIG